ncbi:MAG: type IV secretory system conjugative DNA transfer family protein [Rickettsiales bacterium]|nr:type IV secretory system conjugative DNA transfer family protein [Rickettsiales bacterium]
MPKNNEKNQNIGAHWASPEEIREAGLFEEEGFLLGLNHGRKIIDSSYKHIMFLQPMGHGKGVSIVVPNLLSWSESVIIHDIKSENYQLTSGYREKVLGQKVFLWDPANRRGVTHCYNPLDHLTGEPSDMIQGVDEIQKIAQILVPEDEVYSHDARSLISTLILCVCLDKTIPNTLGSVLWILRTNDLNSYLEDAPDKFGDKLGWFGHMNVGAFLKKNEGDREWLKNVAASALGLWADPQINMTTSRSDFSLEDFNAEKSTLYVGVHPTDSDRLKPLLQIFYQQCISALTLREPVDDRIGVLLLLDELAGLGRMKFIEDAFAFARVYRLKICPLIYNLSSLESIYGHDAINSILANCALKVACCTNDYYTINTLVDLVGDRIITYGDGNIGERPLMLARDVVELPIWNELIISDRLAIKCDKFMYYNDPDFKNRVLDPAAIPSLNI